MMADIKMPNGCQYVGIDTLVPYAENPKEHDKKQIEKIVETIKRVGWGDPILVCPETNEILSGHGRLMAAQKLGLSEVPVVYAPEGLTDKQKADMVIAANKLGEMTGYNDYLDSLMDKFGLVAEDYGMRLKKLTENTYTDKINIPQYEVHPEVNVTLDDCYDTVKMRELIRDVDDADIPEDVKDFLRCAAYRHIIFNYANIAEYYARADAKVQKLMEDSALVIIDYQDAIRNGYVQLNDAVSALISGDDDE